MNSKYFTILSLLQRHDALFSEFWSLGTIIEDESIPTAAVQFDAVGQGIYFIMNPKFWNSLTDYDKAFVIAHECLHLYLDHGKRAKPFKNHMLCNIAQDLVVNHYLVNGFNFDRDKLTFAEFPRGGDSFCWVDTIFDKPVSDKLSFEEYYKLLDTSSNNSENAQCIDSHNHSDGSQEGDGQSTKVPQDFIDEVLKRISSEEMESLENKIDSNKKESDKIEKGITAGNLPGNITKIIAISKVVKKRKWETVVQDIVGRFLKDEDLVEVEKWGPINRSLACLSNGLMLPAETDDYVRRKDKIDLWFFQDTSGSCLSYTERFFKAALSIPEDRFRIRTFCFDTRVYEVDFKKGELKGFGGTAFDVIEDEIQRIIKKENCDYPQSVFLITDGYGNSVSPEYPKRWHWFLTHGGSKHCIPNTCNTYSLADYE